MLDFVEIRTKESGKSKIIVYPEFKSTFRSNDLMIRGGQFYAFWDESKGLWNRDVYDLRKQIDEITIKAVDSIKAVTDGSKSPTLLLMDDFSSGLVKKFNSYCKEVSDNYKPLDEVITFSNTAVKKRDYVSIRLPYPLREGPISYYNKLMNVLYEPKERLKIEYAIGSIVAGDSKNIQKFYVLYGSAGTGKSTVLHIIEDMFQGYYTHFESEALGRVGDFSLESFKENPLIALDHEGKLDHIEKNTTLNSIVSHDTLSVNVKFASKFSMRFNTVMIIGTNNPVSITDSKSGLLRRLIDIHPSGNLLTRDDYDEAMEQIQFELPGIAYHCLQVYLKRGPKYYDNYKPTLMMDETNHMYNFVRDMLWDWETEEELTLSRAWNEYKLWTVDNNIRYPLSKMMFKRELKSYFKEFKERTNKTSNVFCGLRMDKFEIHDPEEPSETWLTFKHYNEPVFDKECMNCYAQYASDDGIPRAQWRNVRTRLREIDNDKLHYVKVPKQHVVVDFDKKNDKGEKDLLLNIAAAAKFPPTYAELSKSGCGIHLHYIYDGDVDMLSRIYDDDVEIKVFNGDSSLRRQYTKSNNRQISTISSGLPIRKEKPQVIDDKGIENERHLRVMIRRCLNKEHHGHTAPEVDFIKKLVDETYASGVSYDVRDLKPAIVTFAMGSSNQAQKCFEKVSNLHYCSKDYEEQTKKNDPGTAEWNNAPIVFYDVEVFPNLFIVCYKQLGAKTVTRMINPEPNDIKVMFGWRLVGFNNRRYDNHILYARSQGYSIEELFKVSQKIINNNGGTFGAAWGLSYTDIYDYCSNKNKMSLKKWEIKLGIYHVENALPWDQPVEEKYWDRIADYCCNDVEATEAVWNATQADWRAREILVELSGLTPNDTTNSHTQQIIFGDDRHPQSQFNYPDLSKEFPGYKFEKGVSTYMGETVGEGGYVYFKPGMYGRTLVPDVGLMHPHSIYAMKLFGDEYTERFYSLVKIRMYIKRKEYDKVAQMFDGKLAKYLGSDAEAKELSSALKTAINSVYGLTAASFDNRCRDPRNIDNVVAKRGALFMITLKNKVIDMGYEVIHCKTDSIKIHRPDKKIIDFVFEFGKKYGYEFEVEDEFERICLVNGSTYIAKDMDGKWEAKAAQFAHPFVYKSLFTHEDITFEDMCETKNVSKGVMYLDFNEGDPEKHNYRFIGKVGRFVPVMEGCGGGQLVSTQDEIKYDAVSGTKGYRWMESDVAIANNMQDKLDMDYYNNLAASAIKNIENYGDFTKFTELDPVEYIHYIDHKDDDVPFDSVEAEKIRKEIENG